MCSVVAPAHELVCRVDLLAGTEPRGRKVAVEQTEIGRPSPIGVAVKPATA
jgi:hypothetical protein